MQFLCPSGDFLDSLGQAPAIHWFRPMDQGDSVVNLRALHQLQAHNPWVTLVPASCSKQGQPQDQTRFLMVVPDGC